MKLNESCDEPVRKMLKSEEINPFFVRGASTSFSERQKSIFGMLDVVENENSNNRYTVEDLNCSETKLFKTVSNCKKEMKQFMGQESIFKRPEAPMPGKWKRKMADFQVNPHKWTKYSLEDVKTDDKSNTAAAVAFFKEVSLRTQEKTQEDDPSHRTSILFNRHVKEMTKDKHEPNEKPTFISGKYVMPEYVVGQKIKKKKAVKNVEHTSEEKCIIKLDHLFDEEKD